MSPAGPPQGANSLSLLPIYARDILDTGPWGLGLLRSSIAVGGLATAWWLTHHPLRGRVSAVNSLFIGASNQLGEFESGVTAAWLGVVPLVVVGGIGTLVVVALWRRLFPALRNVDRLESAAVVTQVAPIPPSPRQAPGRPGRA